MRTPEQVCEESELHNAIIIDGVCVSCSNIRSRDADWKKYLRGE